MVSAQQYQVIQAGLTAIGPVFYVMPIDESRVCASWEATAAIPDAERAAHWRWNRPGTAADGERFTVFILLDAYDRTITGNSSRCFRGNVRAIVDVRCFRGNVGIVVNMRIILWEGRPGLDDQGALLHRKSGFDNQAAIMVIVVTEFAIAVLLISRRSILNSLGRTIFRHQLFDVMRRAMFGNHQQVVFIGLIGDAGHRTHFGITQLAPGKSLIHLRQLRQRIGHPYFLTCRVHADATFEIEPVGAGVKAQFFVVLLVVEFVNEREQAGLSGVDVAAQFGNLLAELLRI